MRPTVSTRRSVIFAEPAARGLGPKGGRALFASRTPVMVERAALRALQDHQVARATGERVRFAREAAGITQTELGHAIGKTGSTVGNVEHGRRQLTGIEQVVVSRVLGVSVGWLRGSRTSAAATRGRSTAVGGL